VAFGPNSDVTAEAAGAVILDASLAKVDELMHIGRRMRTIALQSAVGGMALSLVGMIAALLGYRPPSRGRVGARSDRSHGRNELSPHGDPVRDLSDFD
jgi:cation transport ATPase